METVWYGTGRGQRVRIQDWIGGGFKKLQTDTKGSGHLEVCAIHPIPNWGCFLSVKKAQDSGRWCVHADQRVGIFVGPCPLLMLTLLNASECCVVCVGTVSVMGSGQNVIECCNRTKHWPFPVRVQRSRCRDGQILPYLCSTSITSG